MITATTTPTYIPEWDEYVAVCPCTGRSVTAPTAAQCLSAVQESGEVWARHNRGTGAQPKYPTETHFALDNRGRVVSVLA